MLVSRRKARGNAEIQIGISPEGGEDAFIPE
jgi:hypothetical protein